MANTTSTVYSTGICHGLPVLSDKHRGLSAIVVGASGMSGQSMIDILVQTPERWDKIYAVSRRPPQGSSSHVHHVKADLLKEPDETAKTLTDNGVQADVVFFFGYVQLNPEERKYSAASKDAAEKLADINGRLLRDFLIALDKAHISPKRILLQTGAKNYQGHLGPAFVPFSEYNPRLEIGPLFYFNQEDILFEHCKSHAETTYNVTMPSWILGAVAASDMTTIYPLAIYATIQRKLNKPLAFPGDSAAFEKIMPMSSASLNSYFHEWVVLEENAANERFNIVDDSEFTWMAAWPTIASWFGIEWTPPVDEEDRYTTIEMPTRPRGYGQKGRCRSSFNLAEWVKQSGVQSAWCELQKEHGLKADLSGAEGMFSALQFSLTMSWSWATSMNKARKFGWHGHVDSVESMHQVVKDLVELKMLPPI